MQNRDNVRRFYYSFVRLNNLVIEKLSFRDISRHDCLFGLFIASIAFLIYANSLGNGFVGDDHSIILHNPVLREAPAVLFSVNDTTSESIRLPFYRPLTYLTFLIEHRLHGFRPLLMHLVNVFLHAANAFLVYRLARSLFADQGPAVLAGLLFAVHPLHTEGVNFLAGGRNTLLACFFVLMAYLFHHRSVIQQNILWALLGSVCFLSGLFSKETAMMVMPLIFVKEIASLRAKGLGSKERAAIRLLPYVAAAACYLVMRWITLSRLGIQTSILPGIGTHKLEQMSIVVPGLLERLSSNLYIIPKYILTVIYPLKLSPRYVVPDDLKLMAVPLIVAWILIVTIGAWLLTRGRSRTTVFGLAWFMAFWLPVSGLVYFSGIPLADRFLYIPAIGLWLVIADQAVKLLPSPASLRRFAVAGAVAVLLILSLITIQRNRDWMNDLTLYARLVEQYPDNPHGHFNLASAYIERRGPNDLSLAEKSFARTLALDPANKSVFVPLGYIRLSQGDYEGALYYYTQALGISPYDRDARINRGVVYEKLGRYNEALADFQYYLALTGYNNIPGSQEYAEEKVREFSKK